jgi:hypothetical protein
MSDIMGLKAPDEFYCSTVYGCGEEFHIKMRFASSGNEEALVVPYDGILLRSGSTLDHFDAMIGVSYYEILTENYGSPVMTLIPELFSESRFVKDSNGGLIEYSASVGHQRLSPLIEEKDCAEGVIATYEDYSSEEDFMSFKTVGISSYGSKTQ